MNPITDFTFTITLFPKKYLLVFLLIVLLYFIAGSAVTLFYSMCKKLNIGNPIEERPLKEHQIKTRHPNFKIPISKIVTI